MDPHSLNRSDLEFAIPIFFPAWTFDLVASRGHLLAAIVAVAGAVIAANTAYKNVNKSRFEQVEAERQRNRTADSGSSSRDPTRVARGDLTTLDDRRRGIWVAQLRTWTSSESRCRIGPITKATFRFLIVTLALSGLIENDQLRSSLVRTYMFAKRLVDQYQGYNRMDVRASVNTPQPATGASADTTYALHAGALTLIESYNALKTNVGQLRNLLDAELGLKKTPLPIY